MCLSVFIVDFHKLDRGELLEVQVDQIGDVEVLAFGGANAFEIHAGNAVLHFQFGVTGEAVVDADPAVGGALGCAGSFEVFIQHRCIHCIRPDITYSRHFNGRRIGIVTGAVCEI